MNIAIGSDHAGFSLKEKIKALLQEEGHTVVDHGAFSEERADYPDHAHAVAKDLEEGMVDLGILLCGSGNGIAMAANKHQGIRAAICWNPELAALARQHNDANILVLPARFIEVSEAFACVAAFLEAEFEGGRHADRVAKIPCA
jgi:ribose 5-phosphate isomerase B